MWYFGSLITLIISVVYYGNNYSWADACMLGLLMMFAINLIEQLKEK